MVSPDRLSSSNIGLKPLLQISENFVRNQSRNQSGVTTARWAPSRCDASENQRPAHDTREKTPEACVTGYKVVSPDHPKRFGSRWDALRPSELLQRKDYNAIRDYSRVQSCRGFRSTSRAGELYTTFDYDHSELNRKPCRTPPPYKEQSRSVTPKPRKPRRRRRSGRNNKQVAPAPKDNSRRPARSPKYRQPVRRATPNSNARKPVKPGKTLMKANMVRQCQKKLWTLFKDIWTDEVLTGHYLRIMVRSRDQLVSIPDILVKLHKEKGFKSMNYPLLASDRRRNFIMFLKLKDPEDHPEVAALLNQNTFVTQEKFLESSDLIKSHQGPVTSTPSRSPSSDTSERLASKQTSIPSSETPAPSNAGKESQTINSNGTKSLSSPIPFESDFNESKSESGSDSESSHIQAIQTVKKCVASTQKKDENLELTGPQTILFAILLYFNFFFTGYFQTRQGEAR